MKDKLVKKFRRMCWFCNVEPHDPDVTDVIDYSGENFWTGVGTPPSFRNYLQRGFFCDIYIAGSSGRQWHIHALVLAMFSEWFEKYVLQEKDWNNAVLRFPYDENHIETFIELIYGKPITHPRILKQHTFREMCSNIGLHNSVGKTLLARTDIESFVAEFRKTIDFNSILREMSLLYGQKLIQEDVDSEIRDKLNDLISPDPQNLEESFVHPRSLDLETGTFTLRKKNRDGSVGYYDCRYSRHKDIFCPATCVRYAREGHVLIKRKCHAAACPFSKLPQGTNVSPKPLDTAEKAIIAKARIREFVERTEMQRLTADQLLDKIITDKRENPGKYDGAESLLTRRYIQSVLTEAQRSARSNVWKVTFPMIKNEDDTPSVLLDAATPGVVIIGTEFNAHDLCIVDTWIIFDLSHIRYDDSFGDILYIVPRHSGERLLRGILICCRREMDSRVFPLFEMVLSEHDYHECIRNVIGDMKPATRRFIDILKQSVQVRESITMYNYQKYVESCLAGAGGLRVEKLIEKILLNLPFTTSSVCDRLLKKIADFSGRIAAKWNGLFAVNTRWLCSTACNQKHVCELAKILDTLEKTGKFDELQVQLGKIQMLDLPEPDQSNWFESNMDLSKPIDWPS